MITTLDDSGFELLAGFEGLSLTVYRDQVSIPTIGYGCTYYEDGTKVTMSDPPITAERAKELFTNISKTFAYAVSHWTVPVLTQNQFNALFCLCYNIGTGGFKGSTVLKLVNQEIYDDRLKAAWMAWDKAEGVVIQDLVDRRRKEYEVFVS